MNENELRQTLQPFKGIRREYAFNPDIFCPDDERVRLVKYIIEHLDPADTAIIRMYAEIGSISKLAKLLQISKSSVHNEVQRIRGLILTEYEHIHHPSPSDGSDRVDC